MKKFISLFTSLAVLFTLTVPSFAAEATTSAEQINAFQIPLTQTATVTNNEGYSYEVIGELVETATTYSAGAPSSSTYRYSVPLRAGSGTQTEEGIDQTYSLTVYNTVNWNTLTEAGFSYARLSTVEVAFDLHDDQVRLGEVTFNSNCAGITQPSAGGPIIVNQVDEFTVPLTDLSFSRGYTHDPEFEYYVGTTQVGCQIGCNLDITLLRGTASEWDFRVSNIVFTA